MTKVNVTFGSPEPYHGLELDTQSQAAYDHWLATGDGDRVSGAWDHFMDEFERQVKPMIGDRGFVEEVYEVEPDGLE